MLKIKIYFRLLTKSFFVIRSKKITFSIPMRLDLTTSGQAYTRKVELGLQISSF